MPRETSNNWCKRRIKIKTAKSKLYKADTKDRPNLQKKKRINALVLKIYSILTLTIYIHQSSRLAIISFYIKRKDGTQMLKSNLSCIRGQLLQKINTR